MTEFPYLIIMARPPIAGKVKSRLAASIGDEKALSVYRQLLKHTFDVAAEWKGIVHVAWTDEPDPADRYPAFTHSVQHGPDLGERMMKAFEDGFERSQGPVLMIGSDCPGLSREHLTRALEALEKADVVIGPAYDGGYYLIGMNRLFRAVFRDKPWSTPELLESTIQTLRTRYISFTTLNMLSDVDRVEDLEKVGMEV